MIVRSSEKVEAIPCLTGKPEHLAHQARKHPLPFDKEGGNYLQFGNGTSRIQPPTKSDALPVTDIAASSRQSSKPTPHTQKPKTPTP